MKNFLKSLLYLLNDILFNYLVSIGGIKLALGTDHQTGTSHTVYPPEITTKEVQLATEDNLVFAKRVMRFDREIVSWGDSIIIPKFSNPTANDKAINQAVTFNSTVEDSVTISINKHKETSFLLEDKISKQSRADIMKIDIQKAGFGTAKAIDTDIATLVGSLSQKVGEEAGKTVTDEDILAALVFLDDANAPDIDRSFIMKPLLRAAILGLDKFVSRDFRGISPVESKLIGQIYGIPTFVSTNVQTVGGTIQNVIMHKEAFALALQVAPNVEVGRIIEFLGTAIVVQALYGVAEFRDDHGVWLQA